MKQKFNDLPEGTIFTLNNTEYEKISAIKISCCKSINAKSTTNEHQRVFITPNTEVEVKDQ